MPYGHVDAATFCVVRGGRMEMVEIDARDSTYQGQPIARAFPVDSTYAANDSWNRHSSLLSLPGANYIRYGQPRILAPTDVVAITTFRGVPVFAEPAADREHPQVIYLPTRPGCEFQPYIRFGHK
jgi:hypothetical protein